MFVKFGIFVLSFVILVGLFKFLASNQIWEYILVRFEFVDRLNLIKLNHQSSTFLLSFFYEICLINYAPGEGPNTE